MLFAFYLFPNYKTLHLDQETANNLVTQFPHFKWFILLLSNWSFSLFYVIAELWPNAVFAVLFWQFVNKITSINESRRFYPLFGLLGQTALYFSGAFLTNLVSINRYFAELFKLNGDASIVTIQIVISIILILGTTALFTFWILNHKILDITAIEDLQFKVEKNQMSLSESLQMVAKSRYIRLIAILLICYGIAINLIEGPWKAEATKIYKTPTEFATFIGSYISYTGIVTVCFTLIGSNIVRILGWTAAAIITPLIIMMTGLAFFVISNFDSVTTLMMLSFSFNNPIALVIIVGAIQNILGKSTKYTFFDFTKEMSYVPLNEQLKTKGKAAADMIGVKIGKSTSAFLQSMIFVILPAATYSSISMSLMFVFVMICIVWIWAVFELNKEYKKECAKHRNQKFQ